MPLIAVTTSNRAPIQTSEERYPIKLSTGKTITIMLGWPGFLPTPQDYTGIALKWSDFEKLGFKKDDHFKQRRCGPFGFRREVFDAETTDSKPINAYCELSGKEVQLDVQYDVGDPEKTDYRLSLQAAVELGLSPRSVEDWVKMNQEAAELKRDLAVWDKRIAQLKEVAEMKQQEVAQLRQEVAQRRQEVAEMKQQKLLN